VLQKSCEEVDKLVVNSDSQNFFFIIAFYGISYIRVREDFVLPESQYQLNCLLDSNLRASGEITRKSLD